ncbi:MAG: hypothetical protein IPJ26_02425 [Bacteroidetes bacterium]|nr:hypothetical protein [Bacteroidota bacterium]
MFGIQLDRFSDLLPGFLSTHIKLKKYSVIGFLFFLYVFFAPVLAYSQLHDTVKVVAYNLLKYPDISSGSASLVDTALRHPFYRTAIAAINPDILVVEEVQSTAGFTWFLNGVMNSSTLQYGAATFVNGPDTDAGLFYKTSKFQFVNTKTIITNLRNIYEFKLVHIASGDTLRVYAVHLKASSGSVEEQIRTAEVDSLRKVTNALLPGSNFMVMGDFNIYSSSEPAYQKLLLDQSGNEGHFIDMINISGIWNDSAYSIYHTQSTRTRLFGAGVEGGLDDRFDMILYSQAISQSGGMEVVPNSLVAFGNDGNHFNDSLNHPTNTFASPAIINALYNASDHLPVTMKFTFPISLGGDVGVTALLTNGTYCPSTNRTIQLRIHNFASSTINFNNSLVTVNASIQNPNNVTETFSLLLSSGSLAPGQDTIVTLGINYSATIAGTYLVNASTSLTGDVNNTNNAMSQSSFSILNGGVAVVSPVGPLQICSGNAVTLSASSGVSYLWSTGATTSSISVSAAGSYSVSVTSASGCVSTSNIVNVSIGSTPLLQNLFSENMGLTTGTFPIASHENANGFQNVALTMSGTADVRITQPSGGYAGASVGSNIFITNIVGRYFTISGINTMYSNSMEVSFGIYKSTTISTGQDLKVQVSTDNINFTDLSFPVITGGAGWYLRTATGSIPKSTHLHLRFYQTTVSAQYRIDDVVFKHIPDPTITASDSMICPGDSVLLSATAGNSYLWSTGATTSSIYIYAAGSYSVTIDCGDASPVIIQQCTGSTVLTVKCLIEGLQALNGELIPRLYNVGATTNNLLCDTVQIQWRNANLPFALVHSTQAVMDIYGNISLSVPVGLLNQSYYLVVRQLSSIETWSKLPVLMSGGTIFYDFSTP